MSRAQIDAAIAKYADQETLYDQPRSTRAKARVTGPFTVEAVPAPVVKPLGGDGADGAARRPTPRRRAPARRSATPSGATELLKTGIRGKAGQRILFSRVEPLRGHALAARGGRDEAERRRRGPRARIASRAGRRLRGPARRRPSGPSTRRSSRRQVERAWQEASSLVPQPAARSSSPPSSSTPRPPRTSTS